MLLPLDYIMHILAVLCRCKAGVDEHAVKGVVNATAAALRDRELTYSLALQQLQAVH